MIIASIDIGTNTVLLLIAEADLNSKKLVAIKNFYNMPRIGKGVLEGKNISDDKVELLLKILNEYKIEAEKHMAEKFILTATNAFRIAANGSEILEKVKIKLGLDIDIIDGNQEAYFSYLGAVSDEEKSYTKLVIDIGGGSTEIILGNNDDILFKKSFQIGVVTLSEKYISKNPPAKDEIRNMNEYIDATFAELRKYASYRIFAVAVAGTPTTLSCIKQNIREYNDEKVEGSFLTNADLKILAHQISLKRTEEIKENYGSVVNGREDVLLAGTLILKSLLEILNLDEIKVSSKGLRYGAVINYLNTLSTSN